MTEIFKAEIDARLIKRGKEAAVIFNVFRNESFGRASFDVQKVNDKRLYPKIRAGANAGAQAAVILVRCLVKIRNYRRVCLGKRDISCGGARFQPFCRHDPFVVVKQRRIVRAVKTDVERLVPKICIIVDKIADIADKKVSVSSGKYR